VNVIGPHPFHGRVVWLTAEQGGRRSGPPNPPYAATAFVPPETAYKGLASFILRDFDPNVVASEAAGRWLEVPNEWPHFVEAGTVVVITEGPRTVGYFHVESIDASALDGSG
jgi:hypothetical protein